MQRENENLATATQECGFVFATGQQTRAFIHPFTDACKLIYTCIRAQDQNATV